MKKAKQNNPPAKPGRPTHAEAQNASSDEHLAPYRRCRHSVVIHVNGEEREIYCEDEGDRNYKPPCYRFGPCKCGAMDVVVPWEKDQEMRCAQCGAPSGCPNCASEPGTWRLYTSEIECGSCGVSFKRQAMPQPMNIPHPDEARPNNSPATVHSAADAPKPPHGNGSEAAKSSFTDGLSSSVLRGGADLSLVSPSVDLRSAFTERIHIPEDPTDEDLKTLLPQIEQDLEEEGERLLAELHLIRHRLLPDISQAEWEAKAQHCCELLGIEEGFERNFIQDFVINTKLWPDLLLKYEAMGFIKNYMNGKRLQARLQLINLRLLPGISEDEWNHATLRCCCLLEVPPDDRADFIWRSIICADFNPASLLRFQELGAIDVTTHRAILRELLRTNELAEMNARHFQRLVENGVLDPETKTALLNKYPELGEAPTERVAGLSIEERLRRLGRPARSSARRRR